MSEHDIDPLETQEWLDALKGVIEYDGRERAEQLINQLSQYLGAGGSISTPYTNTISESEEAQHPGDIELEHALEALMRWNAAVMVAKANAEDDSLGGHISTFASSCSLYEVGFNHFFKGLDEKGGHILHIQGHGSPGIYARAFLEGRITEDQMHHFRREAGGKGLSSYPHPWLMPDFWQVPTVSMGLGPMFAIYQARFMKYLHCRGMADTEGRKVWAFCGDGEMDEPESMGAITRAGREKLDNLIFVVNCNLQRLDGLVNGNGSIIQELESSFKGAGWRVIKCIWGANWMQLFAKDTTGALLKALENTCDGEFQTFHARGGAYMREHFFGQNADLTALVTDMSDDDIEGLMRGGHDIQKVYATYHEAVNTVGQPVLVLAKTVKGYGLAGAAESKNIAHNVKKLKTQELMDLRDRFNIPVTDKQVESYTLYRPKNTDKVMKYLHERRKALGGYLPERRTNNTPLEIPHYQDFAKRLLGGTPEGREMSTTTAYVQILTALCKDKALGPHIVPITPDESRTFGMEGLFRQLGIFNADGQRYEPEDRQQVMYYKESATGQILQEGINEGGAMSSWLAAATSYSMHNVPMIPFYIYYSMFGFQRIGDLAWMAGDMRAKGFLLGATSGRTTLNGEGLQHEDGHSHIMSSLIPNCVSYDPAYAYELAVIVWHGLKRMYVEQEDVFFYITMMNENYAHPPMPEGVEEGIIKGIYPLSKTKKPKKVHVSLVGSGSIMQEVNAAATLLEKNHGMTVDIWSMTSADELYRDAQQAARWRKLNPDAKKIQKTTLENCFEDCKGPVVMATDYVQLHVEKLRQYMPVDLETLGTDGFGRSDTRAALRDHFEVDRHHIVVAALNALARSGDVKSADVKAAIKKYKIDAKKPHPVTL